jgi:hypothetical protein
MEEATLPHKLSKIRHTHTSHEQWEEGSREDHMGEIELRTCSKHEHKSRKHEEL